MTGTPLRVLRIYHSGVVTQWRKRERLLRDSGVDLTLMSADRWNEGGAVVRLQRRPGEQVDGARVIGSHPFLFVYDPRPLWRALRSATWDVLDIHEEPAALATFEVLLLAKLAGVRAPVLLYSAQNILKRYPVPFRWLERWALRRASAVYSCNATVEHVLREKGFVGDVVNFGIGVDLSAFGPSESARQTERNHRFHVGYVGRLLDEKGIFVLLDAVALLGNDVELTYVGTGSEQERLRAEVDARGLGDNVHLTGFAGHDDMAAIYHGFDVVAVPSLDRPSWKEQFGRVVVEAMACGVPVVTSDGGSLPEVVGSAGLTVPQGDPRALADAILRVRDDVALRTQLRADGVARADRYSWPAVARAHLALYCEVVVAEGEGDEQA